VNKKRHIGNDIVCVVFLENANTVFNPSWIRSHFLHSYVVIQHIIGTHGQPLYRIATTSRSSLPNFTPDLCGIPAMPHCKQLQSLMLSKIVNAERAAYHAPKFLKLTNRSRAQLLMELAANLTEHAMASKHGRATRKISRRGMWLPIGATRPPSPLIDPVREKYTNEDKLVEDLKTALVGSDLADVIFVVGEDCSLLYGVKSILACRSKVFRTMFKDGRITSHNVFSPSSRRRLGSTGARVNTSVSSPQLTRKSNLTQSTQCSPQKGLKLAKKKKPVPPTEERAVSASPEPKLPFLDEPKQQIQEQV
jgi:hypothetical protein